MMWEEKQCFSAFESYACLFGEHNSLRDCKCFVRECNTARECISIKILLPSYFFSHHNFPFSALYYGKHTIMIYVQSYWV